MKIALVQLDAKDQLWNLACMSNLVELCAGADLVVFPECMPFDDVEKFDEHLAACKLIDAIGKKQDIAVIAGGYVYDGHEKRNTIFMIYRAEVVGKYRKRRLWGEDGVVAGNETVRFQWKNFSCIPLICADAASAPSPEATRMMSEAIDAGAGLHVPIVVCSYGARLQEGYWKASLEYWAAGSGAPVLICGVSGKGDEFEEEGEEGVFGGGGSGVIWPDGRRPHQRKRRGIYLVDIVRKSVEYRPIS